MVHNTWAENDLTNGIIDQTFCDSVTWVQGTLTMVFGGHQLETLYTNVL